MHSKSGAHKNACGDRSEKFRQVKLAARTGKTFCNYCLPGVSVGIIYRRFPQVNRGSLPVVVVVKDLITIERITGEYKKAKTQNRQV